MDFHTFAISRNFLYLGAILGGFCLDCLFVLMRVRHFTKKRNRMITLGLCLLSAAIAALMPALIRSGGEVFLIKPLLLSAGAVCLVCALAVSFPRVIGFPLVLIGGLVVVWFGAAFLRFPALESEERLMTSVYNPGDGTFVVKPVGPLYSGQGVMRIDDTGSPLEFTVAVVEFDPLMPLIGGRRHGALTAIRRDGVSLFTNVRWGSPLAGNLYGFLGAKAPWAGLSMKEYRTQCGIGDILPGMSRWVYVNQTGLEFSLAPPAGKQPRTQASDSAH
ncbi:MAG: hypothetical protein LBD78_06340 [Spirochaetaceae bacterium]|jgi:hypothetical protein|nr:hypothetical protein [Spirochaetaceae bacterium]